MYCTGSDRDSVSSSMDDSSTTSSDPPTREYHPGVQNAMEMASNSTNPTVYQSYGMKLKHRRASKEDLPRKYLIDNELRGTSYHSNGSSRGELFIPYLMNSEVLNVYCCSLSKSCTNARVSESGEFAEAFIAVKLEGPDNRVETNVIQQAFRPRR